MTLTVNLKLTLSIISSNSHLLFHSIDQGQGSYTDGNFGRAPLTAYRMPGTAQQRPPMSQMGRNNQQPPGSRSGMPPVCVCQTVHRPTTLYSLYEWTCECFGELIILSFSLFFSLFYLLLRALLV